jgi:hypothetical protein
MQVLRRLLPSKKKISIRNVSIRHPVAHHLVHQERQRARRAVIDVLLVCIFLCALVAMLFVHVHANRVYEEETRLRMAEHERMRLSEESRLSLATQLALEDELSRLRIAEARESAVLSTSAPRAAAPLLLDAPLLSDVSLGIATSTVLHASGTTSPFMMRFQDVTVTRYENSRLGFIMEIPAGWSEAYVGGAEVALANSPYWFGVTMADIVKKKEAMWIHIIRPCISTEATSTLFAFASTSDMSIREATACIPPFLVTLGYRSDPDSLPDFLGHEQFLLSISRTLYPIVSSIPPYLPIR